MECEPGATLDDAAGVAVQAMVAAREMREKGIEAQQETVRAMFDASWKAGLNLQDEKSHVLSNPNAEGKRLGKLFESTRSYIPGTLWLYAHRRRIDGTAPDFFAGLKKLLETYDADFLKDPSAP